MAVEPSVDIDFGSIPFDTPEPVAEDDGPRGVEIVSMREFLSVEEEPPAALVGTPNNAFCPEGGLVIVGGLGGSGKTTWTLDAIAHYASGTQWNDQNVERALRVLFIENEGPRAFFREKLRTKVDAWEGDHFEDNVHVLREPWGAFDFREPTHRENLRAACVEREIDLVVGDPLTNLGMRGGGTPDDTRAFVDLLRKCGLHDPTTPVAFWILHHLNKSSSRNVIQTLSGAWDNWADTIVMMASDYQNRTTIVHWGKVRYGSIPWDERRTLFGWTNTYGYIRKISKGSDRSDEIFAAIEWVVDYLTDNPGTLRSAIEVTYVEQGMGKRARVRDAIALMIGQSTGDFGKLDDDQIGLLQAGYQSFAVTRPHNDRLNQTAKSDFDVPIVSARPGPQPRGQYLFLAQPSNLPMADHPVGRLADQTITQAEDSVLPFCHQPVGWQKDGNTDVLGAEDSVADWSTVIAVTNELTDRMGIEPTAEDIEAELRKRGYTSAASDPDGDIPF